MQPTRGVVACTNTPLPPDEAKALDSHRHRVARLELAGEPLPRLFPTDTYTLVFLSRPDPVIGKAIVTLQQDEARRAWRGADGPGVIYAFWIADSPPNQIKIGRSANAPRHRIADWERSLGGTGESVRLLFAFDTRYNVLAERLIHTTLSCERVAGLRHATTGRDLTEFFTIDNVLALRLFIALVVRYADDVGDAVRKPN